ncbi:MAG: hypothetical protein ACK5TE_00050 [Pseudomonadota bacterium]
MCYLISVAVSSTARELPAHFHAFDLEATDTANPTVRKALGPDRVFDVTRQGCSCALQAPGARHDEAELRRRYMHKGWSAAKIDRAIASVSRSRAHATRPARERFLEALAALCRSGATVRLVSHAYTGRFDEETFALAPPARMALGMLPSVPFVEDTVLTIDPQG